MEIISIYCFISFIIGAVFMLTMLCIAAMGKVQESMDNVQEPINKVHFYVARDKNGTLCLYIDKPLRYNYVFCSPFSKGGALLACNEDLKWYHLNENDYKDLKWEDEPVEVFINLED